MLYDLPLIYHVDYLSFLQAQTDLYSLYFAPPTDLPGDARVAHSVITREEQVAYLQQIRAKKYLTLNGRFTPLHFYQKDQLEHILRYLEKMQTENVLDGIIFLDFYLLTLLQKLSTDVFSNLELIPSINCYIDSPAKWETMQGYVQGLRSKAPEKIILDRSLNRNRAGLQNMSDYLRRNYPQLQIEVLVNEGCLHHCPYKINHDILISFANDSQMTNQIHLQKAMQEGNLQKINEEYGCSKYLRQKPEDILKIPFLRPEDIIHVENYVDILKISGKILGRDFVEKCFAAYQERKWEGNLLDLLDAAGAIRGDYYIFNDMFPRKFYPKLASCGATCSVCTFCPDIMPKLSQKLGEKHVAS